jgi:hypothetical protein
MLIYFHELPPVQIEQSLLTAAYSATRAATTPLTDHTIQLWRPGALSVPQKAAPRTRLVDCSTAAWTTLLIVMYPACT